MIRFAAFLLLCLAAVGADRPYDAIVIGSGISGMASAITLANRNKKVLVLEKLNKAGGCTHTFTRMGRTFETGFHLYADEPRQHVLTDLVPEVHFCWPEGHSREVIFVGGQRYDVPNNYDGYIDWLYQMFPNSTAFLDRLSYYIDASLGGQQITLAGASWDYLPASEKAKINALKMIAETAAAELSGLTFEQFFQELTPDPDMLALLMGTTSGFLALPPAYFPAFGAIGAFGQFAYGYVYPEEGSGVIAASLPHALAARGGEIRTGAEVAQILIKQQNGKVSGVMLTTGEVIEAKNVIASIGLDQIRPLMNGVPIPDQPTPPNPMAQSGSAFITYVILDGPARQFNLSPYTLILPPGSLSGMDNMFTPYPLIYGYSPLLMFESTLKTSACNTSLPVDQQPNAILELFTPMYAFAFDQWAGTTTHHHPADYYQFKGMLQGLQLNQLFQIYPELQSHIAFAESATPLTVRDYVSKSNGNMLGYIGLPTKPNFYTGIPGLYFCGCDISGGVDSAAMTGVMAAGVLLGDRALMMRYLDGLAPNLS